MSASSNTDTAYSHLEQVKWPKETQGLGFWRPEPAIRHMLSKEMKEKVIIVTESGMLFFRRIYAPNFKFKESDPDAIHALQLALDRQDELVESIGIPQTHVDILIKGWLNTRQEFLVTSMLAVVMAEEGEGYVEMLEALEGKEPNWKIWENVVFLKKIFRTVMDRIDIKRAKRWDEEAIQPNYEEAIVQPRVGNGVSFPPAPSISFWRIDDALMESPSSSPSSTLKMREAASTMFHQGRVLSAGRSNFPVTGHNIPTPVLEVTIRAMELTIRSIDSVWLERPRDLSKAVEERLFAWLRERKNVAVNFRFAFLEFHLPREDQTFKINNSGQIISLEKGEWQEWEVTSLV